MRKTLFSYTLIVGLSAVCVLFILQLGANLPPGTAEPIAKSDSFAVGIHRVEPADTAFRTLLDHLRQPLPLLLMQLIR